MPIAYPYLLPSDKLEFRFKQISTQEAITTARDNAERLKEENEELKAENEALQDPLDSIADIDSGEDAEDDEGED